MTGIEKITDEILREARSQADVILQAAMGKAEEARAEAEADCEETKAKMLRAAEHRAGEIGTRAKSQALLERRQRTLVVKQEIIDEVIAKAYDRLAGQEDSAYFEMIGKLIEKAAGAGDGEICFSGKDLARIPADFGKTVSGIAASKGGTLKISDEPAPIENGFILKYGGVEENCSLKALFSSLHDRMQDKVNAALW